MDRLAAVIEEATLEELDLLMEWRIRVLHEVFDVPEDDAMEGLFDANLVYYRREIPRGGHIACFTRVDGEVVGCGGVCVYDEMPSPDNPSGRVAYLMNIYTLPAWRGRGLGRATVEWLIARVAERGITKVYLEASEDGRPLYERLGFIPMPDELQLPPARILNYLDA